MIIVKSSRELAIMREAGAIAAHILQELGHHVRIGISTKELDSLAERLILAASATPSFKGYGGFPASICASINQTLIHGIPSATLLNDGDILKIDLGVYYKGYHADAARTFLVGNVDDKVRQLAEVTEASFFKAIELIRPGVHVGDISHAIQTYVETHGMSLPEDYSGHGVGQNLHEDPQIPNWGQPGTGPRLKAGMTLAIEPMVHLGSKETKVLSDGWTVVSADGSWTAHYENTVEVTETGYRILTLNPGGTN
jgi:methionyl aminopeptidase